MSVLTDADALERIRLRGVIASAQLKAHDATTRADKAEARVAELEEPRAWSASMVGLELRIKYDRGSISIEVVKPIGEEMEIQIDDQSGEGGSDG